jgi:hypothetical protein
MGAAMGPMPNLFIVGAPKSGTTSLYEWLKDHPDVFMARFKEPCYFARDLAWETSGYYFWYGRDRDRYRALFAEAGHARRIGEASTRYLYSNDAPGLIAEQAPDPRIVVMLRNPVDMIASLHAHKVASGTEDLGLPEALAAEEDRRHGRRIPRDSNPLLSTYTDRARFGEQLVRWLDVFGVERVHVMILEEVVADPAGHFGALLEFLDVDPAYRPASFEAHNPAHGSRGKLVGSLARSRPVQFAMWRALPRLLGDGRTLEVTRRLAHSGLFRRRISGKAAVPGDLRVQLATELAPDVERLSGLLGRDVSSLWFGASAGAAPITLQTDD